MAELKPCPFCGGKGKVSFKDYKFGGQNFYGHKMLKYRVQIICNKCRSRGMPIVTDWLTGSNPYNSAWGNVYSPSSDHCQHQTEIFEPYVAKAIDAWNRRAGDD